MSKITFRADDDLVERLEEFDASKSEVMRDALRTYLDGAEREQSGSPETSGRQSDLLETLLAEHVFAPREPPEINVNVTLDGANVDSSDVSVENEPESSSRKTSRENAADGPNTSRKTCSQCGEEMSAGHVYCPNCGEKGAHRVFCDCGDEIRSDWAFCPSCGRRTPAADVLDRA
ncbi:double zinc ribbon domain-containing protein [Haloplanus pelagicus]|jgi:Arc/MetJ-type ribon-helix-helix transcriptional regulator|uniref:double zinc ribbon domain-containing protein n=1 Tax=Haloplanus pelagicus TaxID=2949995 RepID=UPI00203D56C7|nr:zinc ribbon domain-containing protein [Haloplanus sp. HW8-1]